MRENRTKRIEIRLTEMEKEKLLKKAGTMDLSKYIRQQIFVPETDRKIPDKNIETELHKLNGEINRIGVNINQITHDHNSGFYSEQDKWNLIKDMKEVREIVKSYRVLIYGSIAQKEVK